MSGNFKKCGILLLLFSAVALAANYFIADELPSGFIVATHVFLFLVNLLLLFVFDLVARKSVDKAGFAFISFVFVKAVLIFIFLGIYQNIVTLSKVLMLSFALCYLAYLFFSIYLCLKTLRFYEK